MLKQRVITACVLVLLLGIVIGVLPPGGFRLGMGIVVCLAAWEWGRLAGLHTTAARVIHAALYVPVLYLTVHIPTALRDALLYASLLWWLLALVLVLSFPRHSTRWHTPWLMLPAGLPLLVPGWLGMLYLRELDGHVSYILLFLCLVAAADIGAYFSGRRFGRRRLAPAVSPNKTWEGFAGGQLAACVVLWAFLATAAARGMTVDTVLVLQATLGTMILAACSVLGDLFESMVKRAGNVKDSGTLLPGHGGVLDRIDSITAALPVFTLALLATGVAR